MYRKFLDALGSNTVAIDMFDNPIKAADHKRGVYMESSLAEFYAQLPNNLKTQGINSQLSSAKYFGNFEVLAQMIKYSLKPLGRMIIKPSVILSVPKDLVSGELGDLWTRMIQEASGQAGAYRLAKIENYICAARGGGLGFDRPNEYGNYDKYTFVYSNSRAVFVGLLFAGGEIESEILNVTPDHITKENLEEGIERLLSKLPKELPYDNSVINNIAQEERSNVYQSWQRPLTNKIYLSVPSELKSKLGFSLGNYQLVYNEDYENAVIKGLRASLAI